MRFRALASDYDGTLATEGKIPPHVIEALERFRKSQRKVILVTGRRMEDLKTIFSRFDVFDSVVAENGAVLYFPQENRSERLADPPPASLLDALKNKNVPFVAGEIILASWTPHLPEILAAIAEAKSQHHVILNKGNAMILPGTVSKATGLKIAVEKMGITLKETVAVGDAENDIDLLTCCGAGAAVANSLPALFKVASVSLAGLRGEGVIELMNLILEDKI